MSSLPTSSFITLMHIPIFQYPLNLFDSPIHHTQCHSWPHHRTHFSYHIPLPILPFLPRPFVFYLLTYIKLYVHSHPHLSIPHMLHAHTSNPSLHSHFEPHSHAQPLATSLTLADTLEAFYISIKLGVEGIGEILKRSISAALTRCPNSELLNVFLEKITEKFDSIISSFPHLDKESIHMIQITES